MDRVYDNEFTNIARPFKLYYNAFFFDDKLCFDNNWKTSFVITINQFDDWPSLYGLFQV